MGGPLGPPFLFPPVRGEISRSSQLFWLGSSARFVCAFAGRESWLGRIWIRWCLALAAALALIGQSRAEQPETNLQAQSQIAPAPTDRLLFPRDFARGFLDFEMAPPHNEVDLGLCQIQPSDSGYRADSATTPRLYSQGRPKRRNFIPIASPAIPVSGF
jgi:hypothetical protein